MKKIILSAVAALCISESQAQGTISPVVGLNVSGYTVEIGGTSYTDHIQMRPGPCFGALVDFTMKTNWSLQTGLLYKRNGDRTQIYDSSGNAAPGEYADLSVMTLELPVKVAYSFPMCKRHQFFVGAGPYLAVNMSASRHTHAHYYDDLGNPLGIVDAWQMVPVGGATGIQVMDIGAGINAGFRTAWGLLVCLQGQYGLMNLGRGDENVHNYNFGAIAGYSFKLKKNKAHTEESANHK